ncbi:hypothetical protein IEC97_12785 [Neobacillus cucumis]|uniref:COG4315 family predicted lipoprotein n=1 Tax=Neobacillus cucumis TaxID=1740721 RepID=UPI0018DFE891|nr:hypothetical protein [Neobacillus cucumis]MBI0578239.1 hypothetical protein [Neobacillus cucumis]
MKKWSWLFSFLLLAGVLLVGCSTEKKDKEASTQVKVAASQPATALKVMDNKKAGEYLADSKGMALYYFAKDNPNITNCKGECLQNWPAFYSDHIEVPKGFNKGDFGTIHRDDTGKNQVTYKGYPLYYFVKDKASGDVNGQGVKGVWFLVNSTTTLAP